MKSNKIEQMFFSLLLQKETADYNDVIFSYIIKLAKLSDIQGFYMSLSWNILPNRG